MWQPVVSFGRLRRDGFSLMLGELDVRTSTRAHQSLICVRQALVPGYHLLAQYRTVMEFVTRNMKELELELRSHSIVLEAVQQGVILPEQIAGSLHSARQSATMLAYVEEKYRQVAERLALDERLNGQFDEPQDLDALEEQAVPAAPTRRFFVH